MNDQSFSQPDVTVAPPELSMDVDDTQFAGFINSWKKKAEEKYKEKKIKERAEFNKRYYFGHQVDVGQRVYKGITGDRTLKTYEKPYVDNVIKEGEDILRPILISRLPDLIVDAGVSKNEYAQQTAEKLSEVVNTYLTSRQIKKVISRGLRHHPIYYLGIIKYRWDPNKGRNGAIVFETIHPDDILVDMTATEADESHMKIICHYVTKSLKEWIMLFPDKKEEIIEYAESKGEKISGQKIEESMAVDLRLPEIWFDYIESPSDNEDEGRSTEEVEAVFGEEDQSKQDEDTEPKFKTMSGVCWMLGEEVLDKRLNPNWDWNGHQEVFYNGQPVPEEMVGQLAFAGASLPGVETKTVYRNYFSDPRKPFIFISYEQYGKMPYDEITRIEDNLLIQENYDYRNMQITKMIDDARGKHVFSGGSGLKKNTIEEMDLDNPDEDIFVRGKLSEVHTFIKKEQPSQQMFGDAAGSRDRILSKLHISAPTRGEIRSNTATTNQIARESDFNVADDVSDDTVNEPVTKMAEALLHMMKLRFTPEHFEAVIGNDFDGVIERFTNDMIENGFEVKISASGTDKLKAERQAKDEAQLKMIDPINYYKDTGRIDPEKRAEMLFLFETNPELYYKKYIKGEDLPDIAEQIMFANQQRLQQMGGNPNGGFGRNVPQPTTPTIGQPPSQPTANDTTNIATQPQGGQQGLMSKATSAISGLLGR